MLLLEVEQSSREVLFCKHVRKITKARKDFIRAFVIFLIIIYTFAPLLERIEKKIKVKVQTWPVMYTDGQLNPQYQALISNDTDIVMLMRQLDAMGIDIQKLIIDLIVYP